MVNNFNMKEIMENCKNKKYNDIAKKGSASCFDYSDDYVVVVHNNSKASENFKQLSEKLGDNSKCIYTVVDYIVDEDNKAYELQRKAKGEHFRIDGIKQHTYDGIASLERYVEKMKKDIAEGKNDKTIEYVNEYYKDNLKKYKDKISSPEFSTYLNTRGEELNRRYSMIMEMPKEHLVDFFESILILQDNKMEYDSSGNNILYDKDNGFSIIDLTDCSRRKNMKADVSTLLDSNNYQTMNILLGVNKFSELHEEEKPTVQENMKSALLKICSSIQGLEYNGEKLTKDMIEKSLETYKEYGLEFSPEEIDNIMNKGHSML